MAANSHLQREHATEHGEEGKGDEEDRRLILDACVYSVCSVVDCNGDESSPELLSGSEKKRTARRNHDASG